MGGVFATRPMACGDTVEVIPVVIVDSWDVPSYGTTCGERNHVLNDYAFMGGCNATTSVVYHSVLAPSTTTRTNPIFPFSGLDLNGKVPPLLRGILTPSLLAWLLLLQLTLLRVRKC